MPSDDATIAAGSKAPGGAGPLNGFRVVELAMWVAGPSAAGTLADWGADVIKIEPPQGDPQRHIFGALGHAVQTGVPPFEIDNRGKRSVVIDLGTPEGRERLDNILATADAFITNLRPAALERLGVRSRVGARPVSAARVREPDGIRARRTRPRPGRLRRRCILGPFGNGAHVRAARGAGACSARRHGRPHHGDDARGRCARQAARARTHRTGAASRRRASCGPGCTPSAGTSGSSCASAGASALARADESRSPLTNSYLAADGKGFWLICLETDRHWPNLIVALDRPDLAADPRFADASSRLANSVDLVAVLDEAFASRPYQEWAERFDAVDVWYSPINSLVEVIADPQVAESGGIVEMSPRDGEEPYRAIALTGRLRPSPAAPGPGAVPRRAHGGCARRT